MFGLLTSDIEEIIRVLRQFPEVEMAYIIGSRAKGNYRNGSDVDIAVKGKIINPSIAANIRSILNEDTNMPYHFDILDYQAIQNIDLKDHIDRVGKLFYENSKGIAAEPKIKYGK